MDKKSVLYIITAKGEFILIVNNIFHLTVEMYFRSKIAFFKNFLRKRVYYTDAFERRFSPFWINAVQFGFEYIKKKKFSITFFSLSIVVSPNNSVYLSSALFISIHEYT